MIRQLMREQFRAHRGYVVWTSALLTLAVGLASYASFVAIQSQAGVSSYVRSVYGMDGDWRGWASLYEPWDDGPAYVSWEDASQAMVDAADDGSHAAALVNTNLNVMAVNPDALDLADAELWYWEVPQITAMTGEVDWDAMLLDGAAPREGEIAVGAEWAAVNGVQIGDEVQINTYDWTTSDDATILLDEFTVSGTLRGSLAAKYGTWLNKAIVSWDSVTELDAALLATDQAAEGDVPPVATQIDVSADVQTPALSVFTTNTRNPDYYGSSIDIAAVVLAITAGVLLVGLVGMAFAVGRAQAQQRTRWVATARVLGARRSAIVSATLLELLLVGAAAAAVGVGSAYVLFAADWSRVVTDNPEALASATPNVPWWVTPVLVGATFLIACILGAVPAFWAARVTPVAALKPVTPVAEAQTSRTVPVWPLLAIWAPLAWFTLVAVKSIGGQENVVLFASTDAFYLLAWLVGGAAAVTSTMLIVELSRRVTSAVVRRLARGVRPWQIAASTALSGRSRQASGPASVLAVASTIVFAAMTWLALANWVDLAGAYPNPDPFLVAKGWGWGDGTETFDQWVVIATFGALTLAALAAFLAARTSETAEADATAALGLTVAGARIAAAVRFALPLVTSVMLGGVLGIAGAVVLFARVDWSGVSIDGTGVLDASAADTLGSGWALANLSHALPLLLVTLLVALGWIAVGMAAAAVTARTRSTSRPRVRA